MAVPSADFGYRSNPGLEDRLTLFFLFGQDGFSQPPQLRERVGFFAVHLRISSAKEKIRSRFFV